MNTRLLLPSPPQTFSRSSSVSLTPLSPLTPMTLSLPRSPSPVDWTLTNQWWCRRLPPPSSSCIQSTSPTTPLCVRMTQRYAYPVPPGDPIVPNSTNPDVQSVTPSARSQAGPPTDASVNRKWRGNPSTSLQGMRSSTIWGQYIRTQGGRLPDPAYPMSSVQRRVRRKTTKTAVTKKTTTTTKSLPSSDPGKLSYDTCRS